MPMNKAKANGIKRPESVLISTINTIAAKIIKIFLMVFKWDSIPSDIE